MNQEMAKQALQEKLNSAMDNVCRARAAFRGMTPEQMQQQHGESGKTRAEILAEYESYAAEIRTALEEPA